MNIVKCEQCSEEWFEARLGMVTASKFADILSKGVGRNTYLLKLAAERLTGITQDTYSNAVMERGIETELEAREYYEALNRCDVEVIGFVKLDDWIGASPDGLVGDDGLIEIKCPNTTTHISTILLGRSPSKYKAQIQGQLMVINRKWCDFVSFDPRMDANPFFCVRVKRDEKYIATLKEAIRQFVNELKDTISKVCKEPF